MDYQTVLNEVETWPINDRIRLVQDVWDALLDQGHEPELTEAMKAELDRRVSAMDQNPDSGIPWEQVKARLLQRLQLRRVGAAKRNPPFSL